MLLSMFCFAIFLMRFVGNFWGAGRHFQIFVVTRVRIWMLPTSESHKPNFTSSALLGSWEIPRLRSWQVFHFPSLFMVVLISDLIRNIAFPMRATCVLIFTHWYFVGRGFLEFPGRFIFFRTKITTPPQFIAMRYFAPTSPKAVSFGHISFMFVVLILDHHRRYVYLSSPLGSFAHTLAAVGVYTFCLYSLFAICG